MRTCTFFGHGDCPEAIEVQMEKLLTVLVTDYFVDMFYVGNQGQFDAIAYRCLQKLGVKYRHIRFAVVLAYMPRQPMDGASDTMLPKGIESIHPRYAISWRNRWMLMRSDCVVTYVTHSWGGAAQWEQKARRLGKKVFPLT